MYLRQHHSIFLSTAFYNFIFSLDLFPIVKKYTYKNRRFYLIGPYMLSKRQQDFPGQMCCSRQAVQSRIHAPLHLAGTSLYRRCLLRNEFQKSLTALPHVSVIIQSEAGVISISISVSIFNFISDVPCEHVAYRKQITGVGMISSFPAFIL